jgi:hypothetical protein
MLAPFGAKNGPPEATLAGLSAADWHALGNMAWQRCLQPRLHAGRGLGDNKPRNAIPSVIRQR